MIEELKEVKKLREEMELLKSKYNMAVENFNSENADLIDQLNKKKEMLKQSEDNLRRNAEIEYEATGRKNLGHGVKIRVKKTLDYDPSQALNWAKSHNMALKLDKSAFEKIAKAQPIDFVEIKEKPQGTIPTNIDIEV